MNVGIVGLGVIGREVCKALDVGIPGLKLAGATARDRAKAEQFLGTSPLPFLSLDDLVAASNLVVEASTQAHLQEVAPKALTAGRDLVVLSCGGSSAATTGSVSRKLAAAASSSRQERSRAWTA